MRGLCLFAGKIPEAKDEVYANCSFRLKHQG